MNVIKTRFAPSPTGKLHIGSARTALFNFLYARSNGGKFVLRIEDTDQERSNADFTESIQRDLKWLGIYWDGDLIFQNQNQKRHIEIANLLLKLGCAYKCYLSEDEINNQKLKNPYSKIDSPWRNKTNASNALDFEASKFTIRLKINQEAIYSFEDSIHGICKRII